jgi:hypothetical protein
MNTTYIAEQFDVHINDRGMTVRYHGVRVTDTRSDTPSPSGATVSPPGPIALGPVVLDPVEVSS